MGIPLVSIVHHLRSDEAHPPARRSLYCAIEKYYVNTIDGFIYNSRTTAQRVKTLLAAPKAGVIAYPAADHLMPPDQATVAALIEQRAAWSGPLRVLAVGNVTPRKNLHVVLRALARLPAGWTLTVAGSLDIDGAYSVRLQALARELQVGDQVRFLGRTDESTLRQLYATSHVLALPSFEGYGIVYLEAMSFGVTPIASTDGAAYEIITDGQDGYLTPPDDVARLAQRLAALQSNTTWRSYGLAARRRYTTQPTWQQSMHAASVWLHEFVTCYLQSPAAPQYAQEMDQPPMIPAPNEVHFYALIQPLKKSVDDRALNGRV